MRQLERGGERAGDRLPHGGSVTVQFNPYLFVEHPIIRCVLCVNTPWVGLWKCVPPLTPTLRLSPALPLALALPLSLTLALPLSLPLRLRLLTLNKAVRSKSPCPNPGPNPNPAHCPNPGPNPNPSHCPNPGPNPNPGPLL